MITDKNEPQTARAECLVCQQERVQRAAPDLLAACVAAQDWLNRYTQDGAYAFGGESELGETLQAAIGKAQNNEIQRIPLAQPTPKTTLSPTASEDSLG